MRAANIYGLFRSVSLGRWQLPGDVTTSKISLASLSPLRAPSSPRFCKRTSIAGGETRAKSPFFFAHDQEGKVEMRGL
jgi:hypothetical protein